MVVHCGDTSCVFNGNGECGASEVELHPEQGKLYCYTYRPYPYSSERIDRYRMDWVE